MSLTRREFLRRALALGLGTASAGPILALAGCGPQPTSPLPGPEPTAASTALSPTPASGTPGATLAAEAIPMPTALPTQSLAVSTPAPAAGQAYLAAVRGADPAASVERAIAALGGIERFCRPGFDVIVKPNICTAYHGPEYATTTNPDVVAALVRLCLGAGAKRVRVMDFPFGGSPKQAYQISGIQTAVEAAGGEMLVMASMMFKKTAIPQGQDIHEWTVFQDALTADLLINVPIAKHHNLTRLTLGIKNLMGLIQDRNRIHGMIAQRLADLASLFRPALTVVDAVRILMDNGPTGGSLDDVRQTDLIIASHDLVAADAYATRLFELQPADIRYIPTAAALGLGTMDLATVKIEELTL